MFPPAPVSILWCLHLCRGGDTRAPSRRDRQHFANGLGLQWGAQAANDPVGPAIAVFLGL
jgi:hypothetical protein